MSRLPLPCTSAFSMYQGWVAYRKGVLGFGAEREGGVIDPHVRGIGKIGRGKVLLDGRANPVDLGESVGFEHLDPGGRQRGLVRVVRDRNLRPIVVVLQVGICRHVQSTQVGDATGLFEPPLHLAHHRNEQQDQDADHQDDGHHFQKSKGKLAPAKSGGRHGSRRGMVQLGEHPAGSAKKQTRARFTPGPCCFAKATRREYAAPG